MLFISDLFLVAGWRDTYSELFFKEAVMSNGKCRTSPRTKKQFQTHGKEKMKGHPLLHLPNFSPWKTFQLSHLPCSVCKWCILLGQTNSAPLEIWLSPLPKHLNICSQALLNYCSFQCYYFDAKTINTLHMSSAVWPPPVIKLTKSGTWNEQLMLN